MRLRRRDWLLGAPASLAALWGCAPRDDSAARYDGGWIGASHERAHRLRGGVDDAKSGALPAPAVQRRAGVLVVGAGIAGLAAARAAQRAGVDDVHLLELEDAPGGNSRGHRIAGIACPLGAHYLPLPGPDAVEVAALLDELGLRRVEHGRAHYDERHLCHAPHERLWIDGRWQDGLLPRADGDAALAAQYRAFADAVDALRRELPFAMPSARAPWRAGHRALDAQTFAQWLDARGFAHPRLRWYLDYCCRDDYGAGAAQVSAWAGVHYFASRHGFRAPGDDAAEDVDEGRDAVLTWPEGNAWLAERLARPFADARLHAGRVALRVVEGRHDVQVDAWDARAGAAERWTARRVVLAVPLFVARRLLAAPPPALVEAAAQLTHAPWLVANLHLDAPLADWPGAPPAWDNVIYDATPAGAGALGWVDAMHQSLRTQPGPTVLTAYWAWGGVAPHALAARREALLAEPWDARARAVVADLARAHPDLPAKLRRVDLMRYGHAMAIPAPGVRGSAALRALGDAAGRVLFAHADLSGYSVFEEALYRGERAGLRAAGRA